MGSSTQKSRPNGISIKSEYKQYSNQRSSDFLIAKTFHQIPRINPASSNRTKREINEDDEIIIEPYQRTADSMTQLLYLSRVINNYEEEFEIIHSMDEMKKHRNKRDTANRVDDDIIVRFLLETFQYPQKKPISSFKK